MDRSALPHASQADLAGEWLRRLASVAPCAPARQLYGGRGFGLAVAAAGRLGAPVNVVSAGLGLLPGETLVPSYTLTVSPMSQDWIGERCTGPFDPAA